ncbi:MAG: hypothetical protein P4L67_04385 [Candidatus Pacebacteria bacterium]|nr:hypothetical protein [Candidatus Paceibacterota bacterium]
MGNAKDQWDDKWMAAQCGRLRDNYDDMCDHLKKVGEKEVERFDEAVARSPKESHPESAREFLETCSSIEAIFREAMLAENNWRDVGTEANKRLKKLMALTEALNSATLTLLTGSVVAMTIAANYHTSDHSNGDRLFALAAGILALAGIAHMAVRLVLKKIDATTEG